MSKGSFSEKAKMASVAAQAAMDMMEAEQQKQFAQRRIQLKARSAMAGSLGKRLDNAAAEDEAAAEAGGEAPVGPPVQVAPLPDPSNPSNGLGAGGFDMNSILADPSAVQGGAGVQSATGGLGRATGPSGVDPAALQGAVSPTTTTQTTRQGSTAIPYEGGAVMVPQTTVDTQVQQNNLTPYQLGQLQQNHAVGQAQIANFKDLMASRGLRDELEVEKLKINAGRADSYIKAQQALTGVRYQTLDDKQFERARTVVSDYGAPLADLAALALEGALPQAEFNSRRENILGSISDPKLRQAVQNYADRQLASVQAERSLKGTGLMLETNPDGSTTFVQGNLAKAMVQKGASEANTQRTLSFRKLQAAHSGLEQVTNLKTVIGQSPGIIGAAGGATKLSTALIGAATSFVPKTAKAFSDELTKDLERTMRDPSLPPEMKADTYKTYTSIMSDLKSALNPYQPTAIGQMTVMVNALRATLARVELGGELNIRGYEALGTQFLDPIGIKGPEQVLAEIDALNERFQMHARHAQADYVRMGGNSNLTPGQITGAEPMPKVDVMKPEVTWETVHGGTTPRVLKRDQIPAGRRILKPEDLQ